MSSSLTFLWGEDQGPEMGAGLLEATQQAKGGARATLQGIWLTALFPPPHTHTENK